MVTALSTAADIPHKPFYTHLYVQVLTAIVLGVLLGWAISTRTLARPRSRWATGLSSW